MQKVKNFYNWYRSFVIAVIPVLLVFAQDALNSIKDKISQPMAIIILVVATVIFAQLMDWAANLLVNNSKALRRLIFGRAFIEGFAIDITYNPDTKEVYYGTLNRFAYDNDRIEGEAELFDHNGSVVGNFDLTTYYHDEKQIKYAFEGTVAGGSTKNTQYVGYGAMRFGAHEGRPKTYTGFYIDNNDFVQHFFDGEFLWELKNFKELEKDTQARSDFFQNFILDFCKRKGYKLARLTEIQLPPAQKEIVKSEQGRKSDSKI